MFEYFQSLFFYDGLTPHGVCLLWNPSLLYTHAMSDFFIAMAYLSIPSVLASYVWKKRGIKHYWVVLCFVVFISSCGLTHLAAIVTLWYPIYGIEAVMKAFTASVSILTAIILWPLLPRILAMPTTQELLDVIAERDFAMEGLKNSREKLILDREMLLRELNHRTRNNLQIIESTVITQLRTIKEGKCEKILMDTLGRIKAISRVHDKMYSADISEMNKLNAKDYIGEICEDLSEQFGADIKCDLDEMSVAIDESVPLAQIVNELVTNAIKYGKTDTDPIPHITVALKELETGRWKLTVSDKGPGLPGNILVEKARSLGMRLIRTLANQLGGALEVQSSSEGTTFSIEGKSFADFNQRAL